MSQMIFSLKEGIMQKNIFHKQVKYATFTSRSFASFVDVTVFILLAFPILYIARKFIYQGRKLSTMIGDLIEKNNNITFKEIWYDPQIHHYLFAEHGLYRILFDNLLQLILFVLYILIFWMWLGTTPGKFLTAIKIVDANTLAKPTRIQFLKRFIGYILASLPLGLGFLGMLFNKRKQGFHDRYANTVVVKK
jgi:uncharacterized RDD family membrane protein YckC